RTEGMLARLLKLPIKFLQMRRHRVAAVAELKIDDFQEKMKEIDPDLFLIDVELHPIIFGALATGKPVGLTSTWISLHKRPGLPPLHKPNVPGEGFWGHWFGIEVTWILYWLRKYGYSWATWILNAGTDKLSILKVLSRQKGIRFNQTADRYEWLIPIVYKNLPVFSLNSIRFDFPHSPPHFYHYVGPMMRLNETDPKAEDHELSPEEERLEALLVRHADPASKGNRKLVYCAFGAFYKGNDSAFFRRVVDAVAQHPEWDVIFGLGGRMNPRELGSVPQNVHLFGWIPQVRVLARADAAVIHAGISTINECIYFGVPMLAYPFRGVTDQEGNAARIEFHKLGIVSERDSDSEKEIGNYIGELLSNPELRQPVAEMSRHFQAYTTERDLLPVIEALLNG
ncbi:MAG: nucleotide disphospho-sugar-binding domain-containing protein, partial [Chloroflexota bacterium]